MTFGGLKSALAGTYTDVNRNHTLQIAAALSYYFVLSLFPALIFLSAVVAYLPLPDLFNQALGSMGRCGIGSGLLDRTLLPAGRLLPPFCKLQQDLRDGAAIALMVWLYWTGFAMLLGAELNAEIEKVSARGKSSRNRNRPTSPNSTWRLGLAG